MSISLAVEKYSPKVSPDGVFLKATFSGNYTAGGDTLNLNPGTWTDPTGEGVIGYPSTPPAVTPIVSSVNYSGASAGGYADVVPGTTLATYKLQQFAPGGGEVAAGAYPVGISGGSAIIEVVF